MTTSQEITIRLKIQKLEYVLDLLCQEADRPITVFLPEKYEDQVSYLKKEITKTVEMIWKWGIDSVHNAKAVPCLVGKAPLKSVFKELAATEKRS